MLFLVLISLVLLSQASAKLFPIAVRLPLNGTPPDNGASLWPHPVQLDVQMENYFIDQSQFTMKQINLNRCEIEIVEYLWTHYINVFFPPNIPYRRPDSGDPRMFMVKFSLKQATNSIGSAPCSKEYYPYIQDTEAESCTFSLKH